MQHPTNFKIWSAAIALLLSLNACSGASDALAPRPNTPGDPSSSLPSAVLARLIAHSPVSQIGMTGAEVTYSPVVQAIDGNGKGVGGVTVNFLVTSGGGSVSDQTVTTTAAGYASTSWRLGVSTGVNSVSATTPGTAAVAFEARAIIPLNVVRWSLLTIGNKALPLSFSGSGATWTITGGHYILLDSTTFAFGYDVNGVEDATPLIGSYIWVNKTTVQFYQPPGSYPGSSFYQQRDGLFSTGTIDGTTMSVRYEDIVDFDNETYVISSG